MKYIRTEDGRIVNRLSDFRCFKSHGTTGRFIVNTLEDDNDLELWLQYNRTSIVKQSDTIEELCDEFVYDNKNYDGRKPYLMENGLGDQYEQSEIDYRNKRHIIIYGAIWTDKGLIYVAKMNSKGEFELL